MTLVHIALLASTGCSSSEPPCEPPVTSASAPPDQACRIAESLVPYGMPQPFAHSPTCDALCMQANGNQGSNFICQEPQDYLSAYEDAQAGPGAAADGGPTCPQWSGDVVVHCGYDCTGRRTEGSPGPTTRGGTAPGSVLAERAYLEAVSVHAFDRLERELAAHGAPPAMLRDVRQARRDEVRHTAMMTRLAGRFGGTPRAPEAPRGSPVRSLFSIARENAVEGCVRETYGAVVGLVEARVSRDARVRRVMRSIAADECRHAELAWEVAAWALPRLTTGERRSVMRAMRDAIDELRRSDPGITASLDARVWRGQASLV